MMPGEDNDFLKRLHTQLDSEPIEAIMVYRNSGENPPALLPPQDIEFIKDLLTAQSIEEFKDKWARNPHVGSLGDDITAKQVMEEILALRIKLHARTALYQDRVGDFDAFLQNGLDHYKNFANLLKLDPKQLAIKIEPYIRARNPNVIKHAPEKPINDFQAHFLKFLKAHQDITEGNAKYRDYVKILDGFMNIDFTKSPDEIRQQWIAAVQNYAEVIEQADGSIEAWNDTSLSELSIEKPINSERKAKEFKVALDSQGDVIRRGKEKVDVSVVPETTFWAGWVDDFDFGIKEFQRLAIVSRVRVILLKASNDEIKSLLSAYKKLENPNGDHAVALEFGKFQKALLTLLENHENKDIKRLLGDLNIANSMPILKELAEMARDINTQRKRIAPTGGPLFSFSAPTKTSVATSSSTLTSTTTANPAPSPQPSSLPPSMMKRVPRSKTPTTTANPAPSPQPSSPPPFMMERVREKPRKDEHHTDPGASSSSGAPTPTIAATPQTKPPGQPSSSKLATDCENKLKNILMEFIDHNYKLGFGSNKLDDEAKNALNAIGITEKLEKQFAKGARMMMKDIAQFLATKPPPASPREENIKWSKQAINKLTGVQEYLVAKLKESPALRGRTQSTTDLYKKIIGEAKAAAAELSKLKFEEPPEMEKAVRRDKPSGSPRI